MLMGIMQPHVSIFSCFLNSFMIKHLSKMITVCWVPITLLQTPKDKIKLNCMTWKTAKAQDNREDFDIDEKKSSCNYDASVFRMSKFFQLIKRRLKFFHFMLIKPDDRQFDLVRWKEEKRFCIELWQRELRIMTLLFMGLFSTINKKKLINHWKFCSV